MRISQEDQKSYPKFTQYISRALPGVLNVPVIVANMKRFGGFSYDKLASTLSWGHGPNIKILNLRESTQPAFNICVAGVASAYGCTRGGETKEIEVDSFTVAEFEKDPYGSGMGQNSRHQNLFIVGVTVLHELCHLGCNIHGISEATFTGGEAGNAYEKATYGKMVP